MFCGRLSVWYINETEFNHPMYSGDDSEVSKGRHANITYYMR